MLFLDYFGGILNLLCYIECQEIQVRKSWDDMQQMATSRNRTLCRCGKDWAFAHGVHTNRVHTLIFMIGLILSWSITPIQTHLSYLMNVHTLARTTSTYASVCVRWLVFVISSQSIWPNIRRWNGIRRKHFVYWKQLKEKGGNMFSPPCVFNLKQTSETFKFTPDLHSYNRTRERCKTPTLAQTRNISHADRRAMWMFHNERSVKGVTSHTCTYIHM